MTLPNLLSFLRIPLAFLFLQEQPLYRIIAILAALITDGLDGFLARRLNQTSRFGTLLDPLTDKFFVFVALSTLIRENRLSIPEAGMLICRDFSVILYGFYLAYRGGLYNYQFRAIWCGKLTTFLQFVVLFCLTLELSFSPYLYMIFMLLGVLALAELYQTDRRRRHLNAKI